MLLVTVIRETFVENSIFITGTHFFQCLLTCCIDRAAFNWSQRRFQGIGPLHANEVLPGLRLHCGTVKLFLLRSEYLGECGLNSKLLVQFPCIVLNLHEIFIPSNQFSSSRLTLHQG